MSNLSDLLPSGAGGKSVDFVASGTLPNGQTVILNSDGTVSAVSETSVSQNIGSPTPGQSSSLFNEACYDTANNKVVVSYAASGGAYAIVGTVSGTSISFGSQAQLPGGLAENLVCAFDTNSNKVVFSFMAAQNNNYGTSVIGTVSGTSISYGSAVVFNSGQTYYCKTTFDSTNNRVVVIYKDVSNADDGTAVVGTVSGTSISFGSEVVFNTGTQGQAQDIVFDSGSGKVVIAYQNVANSSYATAIVGTVSGTSISFGSALVINSDTSSGIAAAYDSTNDKTVVAIRDFNGGNWQGIVLVGTVSGTSISFGSQTVFSSADNMNYMSASYDPHANKTVIFWRDGTSPYYGKARPLTVDGTGVLLESEVTFESAATSYIGSVFDPDTNQIAVTFNDNPNSNKNTTLMFRNSSVITNSASFVGITEAAISNTATGTVTLQGGINTSVTGLTIGSTYYVQGDGTLGTTSTSIVAGEALSATSINLVNT